jgi:hypothetical protein
MIYNYKTGIDNLEIFLSKISNVEKINGETEISIYQYLLKRLKSKNNREGIFGDLNISSIFETFLGVLLEELKFMRGSMNLKKFNNFVDL